MKILLAQFFLCRYITSSIKGAGYDFKYLYSWVGNIHKKPQTLLMVWSFILVLFCHIGRFLFKGKYHLAKFIPTNSFSIYLPACLLHIIESTILYQGSFGG